MGGEGEVLMSSFEALDPTVPEVTYPEHSSYVSQ